MQQSQSNFPETSQTAHMLDHLALHGATPAPDETDHRDLPQDDEVELAMVTLFETTSSLLSGSQLEDDLEEMLWSLTNVFHRRLTHLKKRFDDNDVELKELITAQDGSEVKSTELERLQTIASKLWDRTNAYEQMRDLAGQHFSAQTGSVWMPRTGSKISNRALTASVVDSKSYLMAKRRKETEALCPDGTRIAFSGGDYQDHTHGKSAPFKRNDKLLETVPQGLIATPGTGITENLVDKARKLGIRIKRIGGS